VPETWAPCDNDRDGGLGIDDDTVGLNVTVRCGFAGNCCRVFDKDEIRGVVSVELDAIAKNQSRVALLQLLYYFLHTALRL
jgi:hypothetical protein